MTAEARTRARKNPLRAGSRAWVEKIQLHASPPVVGVIAIGIAGHAHRAAQRGSVAGKTWQAETVHDAIKPETRPARKYHACLLRPEPGPSPKMERRHLAGKQCEQDARGPCRRCAGILPANNASRMRAVLGTNGLSRFPIPCSRFPAPDSLLPIPAANVQEVHEQACIIAAPQGPSCVARWFPGSGSVCTVLQTRRPMNPRVPECRVPSSPARR